MGDSSSSDIRMSIDRLDDAFLFALAIPSLLISFIQTYIGGIQGFIETSPILIIGVACPFYVGYVKGAIENNIIERVRGWVYLIVGILFYLSLFLPTFTLSFALSNYIFFGTYFLLIILTLFIIERFYKWLDKIFNIFISNIQNDFVYYWSAFSAISLAFASRIAVILVSDILKQHIIYENNFLNGLIIVGGVSSYLFFGKLAHDIATTRPNIDGTKITLLRRKSSIMKISFYLSGAFLVFTLFKRKGKWLVFSFFILSIIGSLCVGLTENIYYSIIGYSSLILSMIILILGIYFFMKIQKNIFT